MFFMKTKKEKELEARMLELYEEIDKYEVGSKERIAITNEIVGTSKQLLNARKNRTFF